MERLPFNCPICQARFPSQEKFHHHIRFVEKQKLEKFYTEQFPRKDWFDGKEIRYKDPAQYLSSLFNTRANLIKYCKKFPDKARAAIKETIKLRSESKGLTRMLSTCEARTTVYSTPLLVKSLNENWCDIGKELGLQCLYDYEQTLEFDDIQLKIIVDKREQKPLKLDCETISNSLNYGDYVPQNNFKNVFIERKELSDLCGVLSKGFDRFNRELARAREFDAYIVILIESNLNDLISVNYLPHMKHIKATGDYLCHQLREIMNLNNNCQFLFVDGRKEAARMLEKIFLLRNDVRKIDLQFEWDSKNFS